MEVSAMINIYRVDAKTALARMSSGEYYEGIDKNNDSTASNGPIIPDAKTVDNVSTRIYTDINALPSDCLSNPVLGMSPLAEVAMPPLHPLAYMVC